MMYVHFVTATMLFRLMYWSSLYYISSEESGVKCSIVSHSYDPDLAIHDMVMITSFNIGLMCHDPIME